MGEFGPLGGHIGERGGPAVDVCDAQTAVDYEAILEECDAEEIGWLAWFWGPGAVKDDGVTPCRITL